MDRRVAYFYTGVVAFAAGIFGTSFWSMEWPTLVWLFVLVLAVGVVRWYNQRGGGCAPTPLVVSGIIVFVSGFIAGSMHLQIAEERLSATNTMPTGSEVTLTGVISREPEQRERTTHLYIDTTAGRLLVYTSRYSDWQYGDQVKIVGTLMEPTPFVTELGRTFNYSGYLKARGVTQILLYPELTKLGAGSGNPILAMLLQGKYHFITTLESLLTEPYAGLAEGLLLGVKRALGSDIEAAFRDTGIIHIVVLSGYNIMLVVMFITYILHIFVSTRWQVPIAVLAIAAFALIVGLSATVVRASIMAALALYARATGRTYLAIRGLLLAGLLMLLWNPYLLVYDTGFQLSFLATLGLILLAPIVETKLLWVPEHGGLREVMTATMATQLFVSPILLYQIGQFSVVAIMVNVLVLPLVPIAMLLSFLATTVAFVSQTVALPLAYAAYIVLAYIIAVATKFASVPFASYTVPEFSLWLVVAAYAALGYGLWWYYARPRDVIPTTELLTEWVIEDEAVVRRQREQGGASLDDAPPTDTPVFFR